MELTSLVEVRNTREKLRKLELLYEEQAHAPAENAYARELSLRSIAKMIEQFRQEIAQFDGRSPQARFIGEPSADETPIRSTEVGGKSPNSSP